MWFEYYVLTNRSTEPSTLSKKVLDLIADIRLVLTRLCVLSKYLEALTIRYTCIGRCIPQVFSDNSRAPRSYAIYILSPVCFFSIDVYLDDLQGFWMDDIKNDTAWLPFAQKMISEWNDTVLVVRYYQSGFNAR